MSANAPVRVGARSPKRRGDRIFAAAASGSGLFILVLLAGVAVFLVLKAFPAFTASDDEIPGAEGLLNYLGPLVFGTIYAAALALVLAVPLAVGVALFIVYYAPPGVARLLGGLVDLLAAIPSLVFGLWGISTFGPRIVPLQNWLHEYFGFLPFFEGPPSVTGRTMFTVALVLTVMTLPIVSALAREVFLQTPRKLEEAAFGLGATRREMLRIVVLPFSRSAIVSASLLGLGRALGETMAVTIILSASGGVTFNQISSDNPSTIAANIALKFPESSGLDVNVLVATGLVLFAITLVVNTLGRRIVTKRAGLMSTKAPVAPGSATGGSGMPPRPERRSHGRLPRSATSGVLGVATAVTLVLSLVTDRNFVLLACLALVAYTGVVYVWSRRVEGRRHAADRVLTIVVGSCFTVAVIPLVSLIWTVIENGVNRFDWTFFTDDMRNVVGEGGGGLHAIMGTIIITGLAAVITVPIGILAAIYLHEYGEGWLARPLTLVVDVMTGIPSIVAGLFAYSLFTIFLGPGTKLGVMGSVALVVLMIPIVVRSTEEMLKIVPDGLREASYALGVSKWRTIVKVVLPTALTGIVTGVMLAIARIIGETAPLLLTTGFIATTNLNPFQGRMNNLPVFSYYSYTAPGVPPEPYIDRAWTAALVLVAMVLILNIGGRMLSSRFGVVARRR